MYDFISLLNIVCNYVGRNLMSIHVVSGVTYGTHIFDSRQDKTRQEIGHLPDDLGI